jgi:antitoxin component HigA of HigAB toxin-antitoxin module
MNIKMIKNESDYHAALARLSVLMQAQVGTPEGDELELLALLIESYEKEHYPIPLPDPIEAIKFCMEQQGLTRKDMVKYFGSPSKVSEVLNRKRPLSLTMIRALEKGLGLPAEVLVQEPGSTPYHHEPVPDEEVEEPRLIEANEKVREAFQIVADYVRAGGPALAGVSDAKAAYSAQVEEPAGAQQISKAFLRICNKEDLDLSHGQDPEQAVSDWLRAELKRCFESYQSGELFNSTHRLFHLENVCQASGKNSPFLLAYAELLEQIRLFMENSTDRPQVKGMPTAQTAQIDPRLARADYLTPNMGAENSLAGNLFGRALETNRGSNG